MSPDAAIPHVNISLSLTLDQCRHYYAGYADWIDAQSLDGCRVCFFAQALHRIVGPNGVHGMYRLIFDEIGLFEKLYGLGRSK